MTTLATLITDISGALRDSANATFSTDEVTDLINQGIDQMGSVYPREIVNNATTIAASTWTYTLPTGLDRLYRVDIYTSASSYLRTLAQAQGEGPNAGWETHGGVLYLPPSLSFTAGYRMRLWGYGGYTQISVSSATTDLDTTAQWALRLFCRAEASAMLVMDRARFQQWQTASNNTDVTAIGLLQLSQEMSRRWEREVMRLRKLRKMG